MYECEALEEALLAPGSLHSGSAAHGLGRAPDRRSPSRAVLRPRLNAWSKRRRPTTCANAGFATNSDRLN